MNFRQTPKPSLCTEKRQLLGGLLTFFPKTFWDIFGPAFSILCRMITSFIDNESVLTEIFKATLKKCRSKTLIFGYFIGSASQFCDHNVSVMIKQRGILDSVVFANQMITKILTL